MIEIDSLKPRPLYLDRIRPFIGTDLIKVLTGQRRVGKSYILRAIINEIKIKSPETNIVYINLEDFSFSHIDNASALYSEVDKRLVPDAPNAILIDEIQEVKEFEKVIRSFNLNPKNDIYITGSNSNMLSSEISTRLAGRSLEFHIHPLSYEEFLSFHDMADSDNALDLYLHFGGMPYLRNLPDINTWGEYLTGITDSIVYRDIVSRHSLRNSDFLRRLLLFLADDIGSIVNAKKIADYLKSQRQAANVTSVQNYITSIMEAFVIKQTRRWDISGKRFFEIGEKYYFEDIGIRNSIIGYRQSDVAKVIENIVYNHLVSTGFHVDIGVLPDGKEIDFVASRNNEYKYIQVALTIQNEDTAEREFGNLLSIPDNYEKLLVTLTGSFPNTYKGIRTISLRQFLLTKN